MAAVDLRTENQSTVARSAWPGGFINWAAGTGDWVAWVDQSHRQGDSDPNVLWRVWVTNTSSGRKRLLSTNGNMPDPFVPQVHAAGGYVFWTQAEADRTAREYIWKAGAGAPRTALRHVEMTPGSETAADGQLVYLSRAAGRHTGHTVGGDCWAVPLDGHGPPKPLTHTALAMGCAAHAGLAGLVATHRPDPEATASGRGSGRPVPDRLEQARRLGSSDTAPRLPVNGVPGCRRRLRDLAVRRFSVGACAVLVGADQAAVGPERHESPSRRRQPARLRLHRRRVDNPPRRQRDGDTVGEEAGTSLATLRAERGYVRTFSIRCDYRSEVGSGPSKARKVE